MKFSIPRIPVIAALLVVTALALAGCGSSNSTDTATTAGKTTTGGATQSTPDAADAPSTLTAVTKEYSIKLSSPVVAAGKVKVTVDNSGSQMTHEVVFLKTDTPAAKLKVSNGRVSEADSQGEVADVPAGKSKTGTLKLSAGKYVLVCNISGHYQAGMYAPLVVK